MHRSNVVIRCNVTIQSGRPSVRKYRRPYIGHEKSASKRLDVEVEFFADLGLCILTKDIFSQIVIDHDMYLKVKRQLSPVSAIGP